MHWREKGVFSFRGIREAPDIRDSKAFEGGQILEEERSSCGLSQKLKSPPEIKRCTDKSGWKALLKKLIFIIRSVNVCQNQFSVKYLTRNYNKSTIGIRNNWWVNKRKRFMHQNMHPSWSTLEWQMMGLTNPSPLQSCLIWGSKMSLS